MPVTPPFATFEDERSAFEDEQMERAGFRRDRERWVLRPPHGSHAKAVDVLNRDDRAARR